MELITTHCSRSGLCYKVLCSIFSKGSQPFDFIKRNVFRKIAYKVKCIGQMNGGLILHCRNSRIRFFKICWSDCE